MFDWRRIGKKLLFPPAWLTIALAVTSAAALTAVFAMGWDTSPVRWVSWLVCAVYALSFYALSAVCAACVSAFPACFRSVRQKVCSNRFGNRYMTDAVYRTLFSLRISLGVNVLYAAVHLFAGVWYRSVWSVTLAAYYMILAVMRFLMLRFAGSVGIGNDRVKELRRARLCAVILMAVNLALSAVVALAIARGMGFEYNGMLIYVMALYTFYMTVNSVVSVFRYRKYNSPVMSAAKSVSLAAALVSMLALETAMLSQFGSEKAAVHFNHIMIGATGAVVCAVVETMSAYTIVRAGRELKKLRVHGLRHHDLA